MHSLQDSWINQFGEKMTDSLGSSIGSLGDHWNKRPQGGSFELWFLFAVATVVGGAWSLSLQREWGTDFGVYYVSARFLSNEYQIYGEIFTHKGPLYFLFLKGLGTIMGWGAFQAVLSLAITAWLFLWTCTVLVLQATASFKKRLLMVFTACVLLFSQPTNVSIALFQATLLLVSFHFLLKSSQTEGFGYLYGAVVFWMLAVLTRVDGGAFLPLYAGMFLYKGLKRGNICRTMIAFSGFAATVLVIFFLPALLIGYGVEDYIVHNFKFNAYYHSRYSVISLIARKGSLPIMMVTGLPVLVGTILTKLYYDNHREWTNALTITAVAILLLSFFLWIYSRSDKNYHLFILYPGCLAFILIFIDRLRLRSAVVALYLIYLSYVVMLTVGPGLMGVRSSLKDGTLFKLNNYRDIEVVKDMRDRGRAFLVGNRSWVYLFANTPPETATNNWWFYAKPGFVTEGLKLAHERFMQAPDGTRFWIDTGLIANYKPSTALDELLAISHQLRPREAGRFQPWEIRRNTSSSTGE